MAMSMEESQTNPLAPPRVYGRSDEEFIPEKYRSDPPREHATRKCCVYILLWFVASAAIALTFALVVFRVDTPAFRLADVTVESLRYATSPNTSVNATLVANVTVKNTNFGTFKFQNGTSIGVLYAGQPIGDSIVFGAEEAKARYTKKVNVTIEVRLSLLGSGLAGSNLTGELNSGVLKLSTYATLRGKINVMGVKRTRTSEMNCTITLNLSNQNVQDVRCK